MVFMCRRRGCNGEPHNARVCMRMTLIILLMISLLAVTRLNMKWGKNARCDVDAVGRRERVNGARDKTEQRRIEELMEMYLVLCTLLKFNG